MDSEQILNLVGGFSRSESYSAAIAFGGNNQSGSIDIATARNACGSGRLDFETETFLVQEVSAPVQRSVERPRGDGLDTLIAGTLQAGGKAAGSATQQDAESGMLVPIVRSVALRGREGGTTAELGDEVAGSLRCGGGGGGKAHVLAPRTVRDVAGTITSNYGKQCDSSDTALGPNVVMSPIAFQTRGSNIDIGSISGTLGVNSGSASGCVPMIAFSCKDYGADAAQDVAPTMRAMNSINSNQNAGALRLNPASGPDGVGIQADVAYTLEARSEVQCAQMGMAVRRLTPVECERLQGF